MKINEYGKRNKDKNSRSCKIILRYIEQVRVKCYKRLSRMGNCSDLADKTNQRFYY